MDIPKEKKLYIYNLTCGKCHHRFSIESEEENNTKLNLPKKFCPECGEKEVLLDVSSLYGLTDKEREMRARRRESEELSTIAMRQASEYASVHPPEPTKEVYFPSADGSRSSNTPGRIPVKTIEKIREKLDAFSEGF